MCSEVFWFHESWYTPIDHVDLIQITIATFAYKDRSLILNLFLCLQKGYKSMQVLWTNSKPVRLVLFPLCRLDFFISTLDSNVA